MSNVLQGTLFTHATPCPVCRQRVGASTRHWCPDTTYVRSALCICRKCHAPFRREYGHSCHCPIDNIAWRQNPNGTITFGPLADCPAPTIWGAKPIPIPVSTKERLQRQIARLREVYDGDDVDQLSKIIPVLDDLALDL